MVGHLPMPKYTQNKTRGYHKNINVLKKQCIVILIIVEELWNPLCYHAKSSVIFMGGWPHRKNPICSFHSHAEILEVIAKWNLKTEGRGFKYVHV